MNPKMAHRSEQNLAFFKKLSSYIYKKRLNDCSKEFLFGQQPVKI